MNKRLITLAVTAGLAVSFSANANNGKNNKVEEPLRLSEDRLELIHKLTEERVDEEINPTSPEEIRRLKEESLKTQEELEKVAHEPEALFRTIQFKTNNSSEMRDIYLSPNYATTLIFLDKRGNYWPIDSFVLPLPTETIDRSIINTGTMVLTPKKYSSKGNLVVMLKDSKMPLMLTLNVGTDKIDYKTELRIDSYGPNSQVIAYDSNMNPKTAYTDLSSQSKFAKTERLDLLGGITPTGYKKRETNHSSVEVWTKGKVMFIKTREQLLTPNLLKGDEYNYLKGADGSYLYTAPFIPEILLSMSGSIVPVKVK